jgi:hypothetical protein
MASATPAGVVKLRRSGEVAKCGKGWKRSSLRSPCGTVLELIGARRSRDSATVADAAWRAQDSDLTCRSRLTRSQRDDVLSTVLDEKEASPSRIDGR